MENFKLNLGGGSLRLPGFKNVDLCPGADVSHDLRLPLPFENQTIEEIMAIHVIESFYAWEFPKVLADWYRVLIPGGKMTIEFTSLHDTIVMYLAGKQYGKWGLYGNQAAPVDPIVTHHYVYEKDELEDLLRRTGFRDIVFTLDGILHVPQRDWRVICYR